MAPKFKGALRPSLFKLMLMIVLLHLAGSWLVLSSLASVAHSQTTDLDVDPMEPCYLANNRASESLTISESTPVGTVVGEIMVSCFNFWEILF